MKHFFEQIRQRRVSIIVLLACGFLFQLLGSSPLPAQENMVETFSISSKAVSKDRSGIGTFDVIFLFCFSRELKEDDLISIKLTGSGTDLAPVIRNVGKWDRPTRSQMRLTLPLPEIMAAGATFAGNSAIISFSTQINLSGQRKQRATLTYDFIAQQDRTTRPEFMSGDRKTETSSKKAGTSPGRTSGGKTGQPPTFPDLPQHKPGAGSSPGAAPESVDQHSSLIGPGGGNVSLTSGAQVVIPPGALAKPTTITLRQMKSHQDNMQIYSIEAGTAALAIPATLSFPITSSSGNPALSVDVLHFHGLNDKVTLLPSQWQPGGRVVTCQTKEFSIIGVLILSAPYFYALGREVTIRLLSNNLENFNHFVEAALNAAANKSLLLPSVGYNQFHPNTMWCWSSSLSALLQTTRPLEKHLADPLKPQSLAALWGYRRSGYIRTGPSPTEWLSDDSPLFSTLRSKAGAPVEGKCFTRFPALAVYLISQIDQGYPVTIDIHSKTHMLNVVGYHSLGPWIHDPVSHLQPYLTSWEDFFNVINQGKASFINNYVLTTVIKRDVRNNPPIYAINLPSCEFNAVSSAHVNEMGLYFTLPERGAHAGFKWDGTAERYGMRLIAGRPNGPDEEPLEELFIGYKTQIGEKNIEVTNSTEKKVLASIRLELMDGRTRRTVTVAKRDVSLAHRQISRHDLPKTLLFPLLQNIFPKSGSMLARTILTVDGEDKDMVLAFCEYRLFSLVSATAISSGNAEESRMTLKGSGLAKGEMELIIEIPAKEPMIISVPSTSSDLEKIVVIGQSVQALRDATVFLRIRPSDSAANAHFDQAGLETNRVPVFTGGRLKEVSTADDPEIQIPPPPTEPLKKK